MNRKAYLKASYLQTPPIPFNRWDYLLCAIAFSLAGIAAVPEIATLLATVGK